MIYLRSIIFLGLVVLSFSCNNTSGSKADFEFKKDREIMQIIPPKPVKIKVRRNTRGEYSWELTGDNVEEIVKINKTLEQEIESH